MHLLASVRAVGAAGGTDIAEPRPSAGSPFPITIGPEHAVAHRGWAEARDRALSAVLAGRGLVLVVGAPGTGKTLLLQDLARTLRAGGTEVMLQPRGDLPIDADAARVAEAGVPQHRVVLIDEAYRMNEAALERLGRLGRCTVVLAGMPDPGHSPDYDRSGAPSAAMATVVRLAAVPPDEVGVFVAARLAHSGLGADALSKAAVAQLAQHSGGMPRVLNTLAGAALFLARTENAPRIEATHVDQAAALRDGGAGLCATGPIALAAPEIVPCRATEPALPPALVPAALCLAPNVLSPAPDTSGQGRRKRAAALGVAAGVAAACAGLLAWHDDHTRRLPPLVAAAPPSAPSPEPAAPVPPPGTATTAPRAIAWAQPELAASPPAPAATLAAPTGAAAEDLPPGAPIHVALRYARGNANAAAWAASLAQTLRAAGLAVDAVLPVAQRDAKPGAHYFFAEDQDAAQTVLRAARLPGKGSVADAAAASAPLRPGLIELTVPPGEIEAGRRPGPTNPGRS